MRVFCLLLLIACALCCEAGYVTLESPCCRSFPSIVASFVPFPRAPVTGQLVTPGGGGNNNAQGCSLPSSSAFADKILLLERGNCSFAVKVSNAQDAGAAGVIVHDNVPGNTNLVMMSGDEGPTIPAFFVSLASGQSLRRILKQQQQKPKQQQQKGQRPSSSATEEEAAAGAVMISINTTHVDRDAYFSSSGGGENGNNGNGVGPSSMHLETFGYVAAGVVGAFALYLAAYFTYHKLARRKGKRLVRTIRYRRQQPQPVAVSSSSSSSPAAAAVEKASPPPPPPMGLSEDAIENGPLPPAHSTPPLPPPPPPSEEAATPVDAAAFTIEVVHGDTLPPAPAPSLFGRMRRLCAKSRTTTTATPTTASSSSSHTFDLGGTCSICLDDFTDNEVVFVLPCRHVFHGACVNEWLKQHGNCPNCKQDLDEPQTGGQAAAETPGGCSRACSSAGKALFHQPLGTVLPLLFICLAVTLVAAFCIVGAT